MALRSRPLARRRHGRLTCESLEHRVVPAFNLMIDGDVPTINVSSTLAAGVRTFEATGIGATLDVDDIETALNAGENVVITNGAGGAEPGTITWAYTASADDLDYAGAATRSLLMRTDVTSGPLGDVTLNNVFLNFSDNVNLSFDVTAQGGASSIRLLDDARINSARSVTLNSGTASGIVELNTFTTNPTAVSGNVVISASSLQSTDNASQLSSSGGSITINAAIDLSTAGLIVRAENGPLTLNGLVDGGNDLALYGTTVSVNAAVGSVATLNQLTFAGGDATFASTLAANSVSVGDFVFDAKNSSLTGTGTITGDVFVNFDGEISPGGAGTTGAMNIAGNLTFDFGNYALDLGATPDMITVSGDVTINGGNLGTEASTGQLSVSTNLKIIDFGGVLAGDFDNAPIDAGLIIGREAIHVTNYGPAATDVTIAQLGSNPGGILTGADADGTGFTIKLTGDGSMAAFKDAFGNLNVFTRDTTLKSKITISTKANASDGAITLTSLVINGDLGGLNAPTTWLNGNSAITAFPTTGTTAAIKSISLLRLIGKIETPGAISSLTTKFGASTDIAADSIGKMKIGGALTGLGGGWNITNGIGSITAGQIQFANITAKSIGKLSVIGDKKTFLSADIFDSNFVLTGDDGSNKQYGLKSVSAAGNVRLTRFDVKEGNVGSMSVGRFIDSQVYVDYTPGAAFNTGGTFDSPQQFRIEKFTTLAKTIGDEDHPLNFAFSGSEIVADSLGPIKLSGVNTENGATGFGIKFRNSAASVQTLSVSNTSIPVKSNLVASALPLADQFFFLDVP